MHADLSNRQTGFSLVEMLTVIAVIGILAAMASAQISDIRGAAQSARDQRNAQQIVSIYHSARAMGLNFNGASTMETIRNVVAGDTVTRGSFAGTYFGLPHLSPEMTARASQYIGEAGDALQYVGSIEP